MFLYKNLLLISGLSCVLSTYPYNPVSHKTIGSVLNIDKFFQLRDEINEIVDHSTDIESQALMIKERLKELFFGLNNIVNFIKSRTGYKCDVGRLNNFKCIDFVKTKSDYISAEQACLEDGGSLFRPDFQNQDILEELKELFKDTTLEDGFIDSVFTGTFNDPTFSYSNGLKIPDEYIDICAVLLRSKRQVGDASRQTDIFDTRICTDPCERLILKPMSENGLLFQCAKESNKRGFFCEYKPYYSWLVEDIDLNPTEAELAMLKLHEMQRSLREKLEKVERELSKIIL